MSDYTVVKDTREQKGWVFPNMICHALKTGDYTIVDFETTLCIERKGSVVEFAGNVIQKRFVNELERMRGYKYAFLLLEFTMKQLLDYPLGSGIPQRRLRWLKYDGRFILKKLLEFQMTYPTIHVHLCGDKGQEVASSIFRRVVELEHHG